MKVLITGGSGQLGGALARTAPAWAELNTIDIDDCDFTELSMLRARLVAEAPDVILNAAAYTAIDEAEAEEDLAREINAEAVGAMVEAMAEATGKLVHVSTSLVFDGLAARPYRPDDRRNPLSAYGRTKAEGEDKLRGDDLLVRTGWLYEAGGANFVRAVIASIRQAETIRAVADQTGSPTWATGLASTIWKLVEQDARGSFHYCDAQSASWYELALAIAEEALALGLVSHTAIIEPIATSDAPTPAQRPAYALLDCEATHDLLATGPVEWRTNLRRMLEAERELG